MADLSTILKDPNFVNANPATQQAIFDKWAPQDPNYANANAETQTAIRQKFGIPIAVTGAGIPGPRKTGTAVDQIPGYGGPVPAATGPAPAKNYTIGQKLAGAVEVVPALVTGAVTAPIVEASKIYGALTSGQFGTQAGIKAGEETGRKMQAQFYQPRTQAGQEYVGNIANAMASTGLQGVPLNVLADLGAGLPAAGRAVKDLGQAKVAQRAENIAQQQSNMDYQRASTIDAAQAAQRLGGLALNPADSNPNVKTKMLVGAVGDSVVNAKASKSNAPRWNEIAREDMGLPKNTPLDDKAWSKALALHDAPYQVVEKIPLMQASDDVLSQLSSLRLDPRSTSNPKKVAAVNASVDRALEQVSEGLSGKNVVSQIRDFRKDANQTFKNPNATGIDIDVAESNIGIANALENLIEANIKDPKALDELRAARTGKAKVYDWERATGITTKQVDPLEIVKMAEKGKPFTGKLADVAVVAGNSPEIASLNPAKQPLLYQRLRRGGAGGTIGFALAPPGFGPIGAAIGAGLTSLTSEVGGNMLARPSVQNRLAIPPDRRIPLPTEPVTPAAPIPQNRALTPYDYSQQTFTPPNFVMQPNQYGPRVTPVAPEVPPTANMLGYGGTMETLAAEKARAANMSRTLGQQAEAQQAAAEAAARRPTSGAVELQINPLTGVPEIATGIKGATPAVIESANKAAATAAEKMRLGRAFDMTAEEKIQWGKSLLEGMPIAQGDMIFGKLTPQQITAKMQDRAWVDSAITKARQEAQAFDQIAERAANARARSDAIANRERMLDLAEQLQDALGARPVKRGGQGPKTRAFQRNMLRPDGEDIQNALVK